ncbi:MAG TPA: hypothetical protein PLD63_04105 [Ignavibacteria bacterium]|nr:hypothetical protein [Ignavibacteria bacterium]
MFNSILIETVKSFSKEEMKEFDLFIRSPFFNSNQSVIKLYEQIRKLFPEYDDKNVDKKLLYFNAFGKIDYNDGFMRMNVSRLLDLAKKFLIQKNLQRSDFKYEEILLDELNFRELNSIMLKSINVLNLKLEKQKAKDADTYFEKFKLEYFKNDVKARDTKFINYKDTLDKDLMLEQKNLNIFYFISSLKFFQYFLNQKNFVVNTEGYPDFMNSIIDFLKSNKEYLDIPALKVYYYMVLLISSGGDNYFYELKKFLFEDAESLCEVEKYNMITVLRNYAQQRIQEDKKEFIDLSFDILKYSIDNNLITSSSGVKYMSETRFMNIVWTGLTLKKFDYIEEFIKKFINRIEPDKREYVLAYNIARLEFEKGNFSEALEILGDSGTVKNVYYKAAIKQLTLMIYYEMNWFVPAGDLLNAYRNFIKTDKILPAIYKTSCNTFINYYSKLLKINDNIVKDKVDISSLISELELTSHVWLLNKARELLES